MPPSPPPFDAEQVAQREWPALRCRLVDIAAALDRLEAAGAGQQVAASEDLLRELLGTGDTPRAERLLRRLSRPYDPRWQDRFAAGETSID